MPFPHICVLFRFWPHLKSGRTPSEIFRLGDWWGAASTLPNSLPSHRGPFGSQLVSCSRDKTIRLWDIRPAGLLTERQRPSFFSFFLFFFFFFLFFFFFRSSGGTAADFPQTSAHKLKQNTCLSSLGHERGLEKSHEPLGC